MLITIKSGNTPTYSSPGPSHSTLATTKPDPHSSQCSRTSAASPHLGSEPTTESPETSSSVSSMKSPLPINYPKTNDSFVNLSSFNPFRQTKCHVSFPKTPNLLNPTYPDSHKMDSAPDTLCVALDVEDKSDDQNGPRSEQQFECAYCDYASHYYNNFMNHINNNHIESDEEA